MLHQSGSITYVIQSRPRTTAPKPLQLTRLPIERLNKSTPPAFFSQLTPQSRPKRHRSSRHEHLHKALRERPAVPPRPPHQTGLSRPTLRRLPASAAAYQRTPPSRRPKHHLVTSTHAHTGPTFIPEQAHSEDTSLTSSAGHGAHLSTLLSV